MRGSYDEIRSRGGEVVAVGTGSVRHAAAFVADEDMPFPVLVDDDEVVIASLCHDIGKAVSVPNHPRIAAEILKPYVRDDVYWMILVHQDFQGRHYYHHFGGDPNARDQYQGHAAYELAERFADEWDQAAFDPAYDTLPLEHFEPRLRELFANPKSL